MDALVEAAARVSTALLDSPRLQVFITFLLVLLVPLIGLVACYVRDRLHERHR